MSLKGSLGLLEGRAGQLSTFYAERTSGEIGAQMTSRTAATALCDLFAEGEWRAAVDEISTSHDPPRSFILQQDDRTDSAFVHQGDGVLSGVLEAEGDGLPHPVYDEGLLGRGGHVAGANQSDEGIVAHHWEMMNALGRCGFFCVGDGGSRRNRDQRVLFELSEGLFHCGEGVEERMISPPGQNGSVLPSHKPALAFS
jgi:hypothetical protein